MKRKIFAGMVALLASSIACSSTSTQATQPAHPSARTDDSPLVPGLYSANRVLNKSAGWQVMLKQVRVTRDGKAEFFLAYENRTEVTGQLSCVGVTNPAAGTITFASGHTVKSTETYCSDHSTQDAINVPAGGSLMSYAIFPTTQGLGGSFTFSWNSGTVVGNISGVSLRPSTG